MVHALAIFIVAATVRGGPVVAWVRGRDAPFRRAFPTIFGRTLHDNATRITMATPHSVKFPWAAARVASYAGTLTAGGEEKLLVRGPSSR